MTNKLTSHRRAKLASRLARCSRSRATLIAVAAVVIGAVWATPSFAASPWWHLTSGSRPAQLKSGVARSEVQEVTVTGTAGETVKLTHANGEVGPEFIEFAVGTEASAVQSAFESVFGSGNVTVSGGPVGGSGQEPYAVTFTGALAYQPVEPLETSNSPAKVAVTQVSVGKPDGEIYVTGENLGDASVVGESVPVELSDTLPAGLKAVGVAGTGPNLRSFLKRTPLECALESPSHVSCPFGAVLAPYDQIEMRIAVLVEGNASSGEANQVSVSGGEGFVCTATEEEEGSFRDPGCTARREAGSFERRTTGAVVPATISRPVELSGLPSPFGVESYELTAEDEGGSIDTQAGSHPFQVTTTLALNQSADSRALKNSAHRPDVNPVALPRDLNFRWPAGLLGNPTPFAQCTDAQFFKVLGEGLENQNRCPARSAVGVATTTVNEPGAAAGYVTVTVPLFNLEPRRGEPARFGFYVTQANAPVFIDTAVRSGGDYGVTVSSNRITQTAALISSQVTVWGVPDDPSHNSERGWGCLYAARGQTTSHSPCVPGEVQTPRPFLTMPTSCAEPLQTTVEADAWSNVGEFATYAGALRPSSALEGCGQLPFSPAVRASTDTQQGSTPVGLAVDVHAPQEVNENAAAPASSDIKSITVVLPEGVTVNPSAAGGLEACSQEQIGFTGRAPLEAGGETLTFTGKLPDPLAPGLNFCPDGSKIGTVHIRTPLLPNPLTGAVYLAAPAPSGEVGRNPFGSLIAMYIVAEDPVSGSLVKLPGNVRLDQVTGRVEATFEDTPQVPFEDAEVAFFGGPRAALATPAHCGTYPIDTTFTPWSGTAAVSSSASFEITSGADGSPCPGATLPFAPSIVAGSPIVAAGSFSPTTTTVSREEGNEAIEKVQLQLPRGVSAVLSGVALCPEVLANTGACSSDSLIGQTSASVGLGSTPYTVTGGQVFLTQGYEGAPFGLSIVTPAKAGPFDLGNVIVRARVDVDPHTAQVSVTSDPIPHILKGIPLQIKRINVSIDRSGFTFNPTNCTAQSVTGAVAGLEGASVAVSTPFQVANCAALKFAPRFSVTTAGHTSKAAGASLAVKLTNPNAAFGTYANVASVKVTLPKQLPSRLTTLQKACVASVFEADPAACPAASLVGRARVVTPLLPVPLMGPAYLVSHGGEAFPDLTIVLQGYGITVDLVGSTAIRKGITTSTFKSTPDIPFSTFELVLPQGKFSALAANANLCRTSLAMPTELAGQSGALVTQNTRIGVTGCARSLTRKQKLAAALRACRRKPGHTRRAACERHARRTFGTAHRPTQKH